MLVFGRAGQDEQGQQDEEEQQRQGRNGDLAFRVVHVDSLAARCNEQGVGVQLLGDEKGIGGGDHARGRVIGPVAGGGLGGRVAFEFQGGGHALEGAVEGGPVCGGGLEIIPFADEGSGAGGHDGGAQEHQGVGQATQLGALIYALGDGGVHEHGTVVGSDQGQAGLPFISPCRDHGVSASTPDTGGHLSRLAIQAQGVLSRSGANGVQVVHEAGADGVDGAVLLAQSCASAGGDRDALGAHVGGGHIEEPVLELEKWGRSVKLRPGGGAEGVRDGRGKGAVPGGDHGPDVQGAGGGDGNGVRARP
uniref:Putative glycine-rich cell wall protein n=1 Tax=Micrococcus sp. 28 TaxID=161213 RepID=Q8VPM4_9MICC|nr:putative glycine-rich cell wall protein [Micrococcus sp. 28]